jgi:isopenicillin-N N-acyltransferase like protein
MGWPVVRASGGPRERGRAYGEGARERVHRSIELYTAVFRHYTGLGWGEVRDRAGAFVEWLDDTDVQLLPELEGIAEGAGVDAEDVLALNVRTEVMFGLGVRPGTTECTAIAADAAATSDGRVLVAQNWDWKPAARETCVLLAMRPNGRPAFVTLVEAGLLAKCGVNDAGIALATNALTSSLDRGGPGVPYHAILRRVLTSSTHDEAVAEVTERVRASSANYLIGSSSGRVTNVEVGPGGASTAWTTEGGVVCQTNHFLRPDRPFKDMAALEGPDSRMRRTSAEAAMGEGPVDLVAIEAALRAHAEPDRGDGSVCAHGDASVPDEADYVTVAGVILDPAAESIRLTDGNPCEAPFRTLELRELLG